MKNWFEQNAVGMSLNNLSELYYSQGEYAQAEPLLKRASDNREDFRPGASSCGRQPREHGGDISSYRSEAGS